MAIEIPTELNIVALGPSTEQFTMRYFGRDMAEREARHEFTIAINNSHAAYDYKTDLIIAMDDLQRDKIDHPDYVRSIVDAGVLVLTTQHYEEWPATEAYPLREVMDWLDVPKKLCMKLLNNTCNFALAYAAMKGAKVINLWGYEFVGPDHNSIVQRQKNFLDTNKWPDWTIYYMEALVRAPGEPGLESCTFLIGLLTGRGIDVAFPDNTTLLDFDRPDFFYGYDQGKQPDV